VALRGSGFSYRCLGRLDMTRELEVFRNQIEQLPRKRDELEVDVPQWIEEKNLVAVNCRRAISERIVLSGKRLQGLVHENHSSPGA
jgi:hypothetical protein